MRAVIYRTADDVPRVVVNRVCHRCGRTVRVQRRWDDGRWGWSPWRYEPHRPISGGSQHG